MAPHGALRCLCGTALSAATHRRCPPAALQSLGWGCSCCCMRAQHKAWVSKQGDLSEPYQLAEQAVNARELVYAA